MAFARRNSNSNVSLGQSRNGRDGNARGGGGSEIADNASTPARTPRRRNSTLLLETKSSALRRASQSSEQQESPNNAMTRMRRKSASKRRSSSSLSVPNNVRRGSSSRQLELEQLDRMRAQDPNDVRLIRKFSLAVMAAVRSTTSTAKVGETEFHAQLLVECGELFASFVDDYHADGGDLGYENCFQSITQFCDEEGIDLTSDEIHKIISQMDKDGDGSINCKGKWRQ